jgi:hypothetical protein
MGQSCVIVDIDIDIDTRVVHHSKKIFPTPVVLVSRMLIHRVTWYYAQVVMRVCLDLTGKNF